MASEGEHTTAGSVPGSTFTLTFDYAKSTPGTHRYTERAPKGSEVIGSLYVQKSAMGADPSASVTMTLEF